MDSIQARYNAIKEKNLSIDATRGKPSTEQVAISHGLLSAIDINAIENYKGIDILNYGGNDGLPEMKQLFADLLEISPENVIVGGNSSLNIMFDTVATLVIGGLWIPGKSKILCPSPGYDRHFAICEYFGLEMITVPMTPSGPDMNIVESFAKDQHVAGIWCVPVFSNPQGYVYSDETVSRLAAMSTAHPHFKILWDNAYTIHHFYGERPTLLNILPECEKHGNDARPIIFTSFSKISIPGAAVACMAGAQSCLEIFRKRIQVQTIGPDKVNQLKHIQYFKNITDIENHMQKQACILRPKFELVHALFSRYLPEAGAVFTNPQGGYFVSVETKPDCAKRVQILCKEAGVLITNAGATFPYGKDPMDNNLRFAPTFLSMDELEQAVEVFCLAVRLASCD